MRAAIRSLFALFLGASIMYLGNGLQGILIPVRASLEGFSTTVIGLVASTYSLGFVFSCFLTPHVVKRVGHIRTFAVLAAVASAVVLLLVLIPQPPVWIALRVVSGFCFAGLFMVIESWLNERSSNENRGQVFSIYMIINLSMATLGQLLLPTGDPAGFVLFAVTCMLITLALVPVGLTTSAAPAPIHQVRLRLGHLYGISPVGVLGCMFVGMANGAYLGLGPIYAQALGFTVTSVALFMSAAVVGGAIAQMPLGRLSDRLDRRLVIVGVCLAAAGGGVILAAAGDIAGDLLAALGFARQLPALALIGLIGLFGCAIFPLYSLCVAHANDHAAAEDFVETSSGLLLTYGIGATIGPFVAAFLMQAFGVGGLFVFTAAVHGVCCLFTLYRMNRRAAVPVTEREHCIQAGSSRMTPVGVELDPRAPAQQGTG